jgi:hypothetical protein
MRTRFENVGGSLRSRSYDGLMTLIAYCCSHMRILPDFAPRCRYERVPSPSDHVPLFISRRHHAAPFRHMQLVDDPSPFT